MSASDRRRRYEARQEAFMAELEAERVKKIEAEAHESMMAACTEQYRSMAEEIGEPAADAVKDFILAIIRKEHL